MPGYRPDIDGLRALAVAAVVVFHAFPAWLPGGYVGVDLFFVISGYLITGICLREMAAGRFSVGRFYARRVRRIFPALLLVLGAVWLWGWFSLTPDDFRRLGQQIEAAAGFVANLLFLRGGGYFDQAAIDKPLLHLWSLGVEEQFYLIWPLLLMLTSRRRRQAWLMLGVLAASLLTQCLMIGPDPVGAFYAPQGRLWELAIGGLLAWHELGRADRADAADAADPAARAERMEPAEPAQHGAPADHARARNVLAGVGLALCLGSLALLSSQRAFPGLWALLPTLGAAAVLAAGPEARVNRLLALRLPVWLGRISYPLYLWHWPLLSLLALSAPTLSDGARTGSHLLVVALSILLAWISWGLLERPVRRAPRSALLVAGLCSLMLAIGLLGHATKQSAGFVARVAPGLRGVAALRGVESFAIPPPDAGTRCRVTGREQLCRSPGAPRLMVWGDSHAEALLAGLRLQAARSGFALDSATGCGTPPLVRLANFTDARCGSPEERAAGNQAALAQLAERQPALLILHARWTFEDYHWSAQALIADIGATVAAVHRLAPDTRVVVLGPVPIWRDDLAHLLLRIARREQRDTLPAAWQDYGLDPRVADWDARLASGLHAAGIAYLSAWQVLCTGGRCLTRLGPDPADLTAMDYGHLSPAGADYLVRALWSRLDPAQAAQRR